MIINGYLRRDTFQSFLLSKKPISRTDSVLDCIYKRISSRETLKKIITKAEFFLTIFVFLRILPKTTNQWHTKQWHLTVQITPKGLTFILVKKNFEKIFRFGQDLGSKFSDRVSQNGHFGGNGLRGLTLLIERITEEGPSCLQKKGNKVFLRLPGETDVGRSGAQLGTRCPKLGIRCPNWAPSRPFYDLLLKIFFCIKVSRVCFETHFYCFNPQILPNRNEQRIFFD